MKGRYGMKKKRMAIAILAAGLSAVAVMPAFAGQWKSDFKGWWYQNDDGSYPNNGWEEIDGSYYYFQSDGYALMSTTTPEGYYVGADGIWEPGGEEGERIKLEQEEQQRQQQKQQDAAERFVDVSKYFNTDLQDYEKAKAMLGARPYYDVNAAKAGMWYETSPIDMDNIKQIAYQPPYSFRDENQEEYDKQKTFRINYDVNTNQIVSINGSPRLFISGAPRSGFWASELKYIAETAGAADIVYENNDTWADTFGVVGNTIVPTGGKELVHNDSVTFTWNNLKYSYSVKERSITEGLYGLIISRN